jgi:hypothetical protein
VDILITEPLNEKDDDNIVPEGLFNLMHERPPDQSRAASPELFTELPNKSKKEFGGVGEAGVAVINSSSFTSLNKSRAATAANSPSVSNSPSFTNTINTTTTNTNNNIIRSRPTTPSATHSKSNASISNSCSNNSRPPSPLPTMTSTTNAASSRPNSPTNNNQTSLSNKRGSLMGKKTESIPELETTTINYVNNNDDIVENRHPQCDSSAVAEFDPFNSKKESTTTLKSKPKFTYKAKNNNKQRTTYTYSSSTNNSQGEDESSSSSASDDEEDKQKFQIRIRPKSQKYPLANNSNSLLGNMGDDTTTAPSNKTSNSFVPLLPRPPKSQQEIEEFRQRRFSSENGSMCGSMAGSIRDDESSDDDNNNASNKVKKVILKIFSLYSI